MDFSHVSVLLKESIELLNIKPGGIYFDLTLGGGGHSLEILKRGGRVVGIDQDTAAIRASEERLKEYSENLTLVHDNFKNLKTIAKNLNIDKADGIIADLGVSSHQLDEAQRGFSYMQDAPLDMRMDQSRDFSAYDVVNFYSEDELYRIIKEYGEEKWAKRIAEFIVNERKDKEIKTTFELVKIIKKAIPKGARIDGPHPAKRTFQAIRIEVNGELDALKETIIDAVDLLNTGGRIAVITFHSLEDRIVKDEFKKLQKGCTCPPNFPVCVCELEPKLKIITKKPITADEKELEENHRARSAKLRVAEKI